MAYVAELEEEVDRLRRPDAPLPSSNDGRDALFRMYSLLSGVEIKPTAVPTTFRCECRNYEAGRSLVFELAAADHDGKDELEFRPIAGPLTWVCLVCV